MNNRVLRVIVASLYAAQSLSAEGGGARFRASAGHCKNTGVPAGVSPPLEWPGVSPFVPGATAGLGVAPAPGTSRARVLAALDPAFGTVRRLAEPARPSGGPLFVHLQDVHRNTDAQANLARAVEALTAGGLARVVGLEGGWGELPVTAYQRHSDRAAVQTAADSLFRTGRVSGPVFAGLTGRGKFYGLEDKAAYHRNVAAYRAARATVATARRALAEAHRNRSRAKTRVNPALRAWDDAVEARERGELGLGAFTETLAGLLPDGDFPESVRLFRRAWAAENRLDFPRVERERDALVRRLLPRLTFPEVEDLRRRAWAHRSGAAPAGEFYFHLRTLCRRAGAPLEDYPAFSAYVGYVRLADRISVERLLGDLTEWEDRVVRRWALSLGEKQWAAETRRLRLASKLVDFALTPSEWRAWRADPVRPTALRPLEEFYEAADARDATMADRALALARGVPAGEPVVIVTGGYHGDGLARRLSEAGATVIQWTPKISRAETARGSAYLSVFAQEKTPLERLMQGEKLFLAPPVAEPLRTEGPWAVAAAGRLARDPFPLTEGERALLEAFFRSTGAKNLRITDARVESIPGFDVEGADRRVVFTLANRSGRHEIVVYAKNKTALLRVALKGSRGFRARRALHRLARRMGRWLKPPGPPQTPPGPPAGRRRFVLGALALIGQGASEKARAVLPGFWLELARDRARPYRGGDAARAAEAFFAAWKNYAPRPAGPGRENARGELLARAASFSPGFVKTVEGLVRLAENPDPETADPRNARDALNAELLPEGFLAEIEWQRGPSGAPALVLSSSRILEIDEFALDGKPHVGYLVRGDGTIPAGEDGYSTHEGVIVVREEAVEHTVMVSFWPQFDSLLRERGPSLLEELRRVLGTDPTAFFLRHVRFFALRAQFAEEFRRLGKPFVDTPGALRSNLSPDWQIELREYAETRRWLTADHPDFLEVKAKLMREFTRAVRAHELAHERALPADGETIAYINEILVTPLAVFGVVRTAFRGLSGGMSGLTPAEAKKILRLVGRSLGLPEGDPVEADFFRALPRLNFPLFLSRLEEEYRREFQRAPAVRPEHLDTARRRLAPGRATSLLGVALAEAAGVRFGVPAIRAGGFYKAVAPLLGTGGALAAVAAASALPVAPSVVGVTAPLTGALYGALFAFVHTPRALRLLALKSPVTDPETDIKKTAIMALIYALTVTLTVWSAGDFGWGRLALSPGGAALAALWTVVLAVHGGFDGWGRRAGRSASLKDGGEATVTDWTRDLLPPVVPLGLDTVDRLTRFDAIAADIDTPFRSVGLAGPLRSETATPALALLTGFLLGRAPERNAPEKPLVLVALVAEKDMDDRLRGELETTARAVARARGAGARDVRLVVAPDNRRAADRLRDWVLDKTPGVVVAETVAETGALGLAALAGVVERWGPAGEAAVLLSCTAGFAPLIPRDALLDNLPEAVAVALRVLIESLAARPLAPVDFSTLLRAAEKIDQSA